MSLVYTYYGIFVVTSALLVIVIEISSIRLWKNGLLHYNVNASEENKTC